MKNEKCGMCWRQEQKLVSATHTITEVGTNIKTPLIQYVCDKHFDSIFGNLQFKIT